jgi:hypothetical protein
MESEFFFTKIEAEIEKKTKNRKKEICFIPLLVFVEFNAHEVEEKEEFAACSLTMLHAELNNTCIYQAKCSSFECFNTEIEWTPAYFQKVR